MEYAYDGAALQSPGAIGGVASQLQKQEPARTFDGISCALDRVRQCNARVERILQRIDQRETVGPGTLGSSNSVSRAPYASSLDELQEAIGYLGKSLDELESHI